MNVRIETKRRLMPAFLFLALLSGCGGEPREHAFRGMVMGTTYTVKVIAPSLSRDEVGAAVQDTLDEVNALMSTWAEDSEVSRFNRHNDTTPMAISPQTAAVVANALQVAEWTDGALDPTLSPLIELWGFGAKERHGFPAAEAVSAAKARTGWRKLKLEDASLAKTEPGVQLNLSANAKGYGVDAVAKKLESLGFDRYMIEVGGEVRVSGANLENDPWRLAILDPSEVAQPTVFRTALLRNKALATSGDYRNFFTHDGVRYSHILSPETGFPITNDVASVSVIGDDCMTADALATGLMAMQPDAALQIVESLAGIDCLIMIRQADDSIETRQSSGMAAFLAEPAAE